MRQSSRVLLIITLLVPAIEAAAIPISLDSSYSVELLVSGVGTADGMAIDTNGQLLITDYEGARVLAVQNPGSTGPHSYSVFAHSIRYPTDVTVDSDGNVYVASSTGSSSVIFRVANGSGTTIAGGLSYSTSIAAYDDAIFVANSGDGTISKVALDGTVTTYVSGFSAPDGPYGLSFDDSGNLIVVDHATGEVYEVAPDGSMTVIGIVSPYGGSFTAVAPDLDVLISDVVDGVIYEIDTLGNQTVFATGFVGKDSPPVIGPTGLIFDQAGNLYVGDGDNVWRFSPSHIPVPATLWVFVLGLMTVVAIRRNS